MFDFCSMRLLIVASTDKEITPFTEAHPEVDHLITGVGTASTLYHLTKQLTLNTYHIVVQAGIAGNAAGFHPEGGVVAVERDRFAHSGVWEDGTLFTLQEKGLSENDGWLVNHHRELHRLGLPLADAVTVDLINNHSELLKQVAEKYGAPIESMEGAALHYVCLQEQIPFIQLRAISNTIGDRNKANWKTAEAITRLNQTLERVYYILTNGNE